MISTNNKMSGAKVLADNRVPEGFAGATHSHGEREEREVAHSIWITRHDRFVDTDTTMGWNHIIKL